MLKIQISQQICASLIVWLFSLQGVAALTSTAEIFDKSGKIKIALLKVQSFAEGELSRQTAQFHDLTGKLLVEERSVLKGDTVLQVEFDQNQTGAKAVVAFDGKVARFKKTEGGKTENSEETITGDFVMTSNFQRFVTSKWKELTEGQTVYFRFGVWERMETVGFQLTKIKDELEDGRQIVVLKMKPSNFIIAALVNSIEFKFSADGKRLIESRGPVQPKRQDGAKWQAQDGLAIYSDP